MNRAGGRVAVREGVPWPADVGPGGRRGSSAAGDTGAGHWQHRPWAVGTLLAAPEVCPPVTPPAPDPALFDGSTSPRVFWYLFPRFLQTFLDSPHGREYTQTRISRRVRMIGGVRVGYPNAPEMGSGERGGWSILAAGSHQRTHSRDPGRSRGESAYLKEDGNGKTEHTT